MYKTFRDNGEPLIYDYEVKKAMNYTILLQPMNTDQGHLRLPELANPKITLSSQIDVEKIKKYLLEKLSTDKAQTTEDIDLWYKSRIVNSGYTLRGLDVEFRFPSLPLFSYSLHDWKVK
jgi:hypothetical protein